MESRHLARDRGRAPRSDSQLVAVDPKVLETIRVFIVDDEHSLRESCASLLRSDGFSVTVNGRGGDALSVVRSRPFDIILVDLYMSEVSGFDLIGAALELNPATIIIVMTGNPSVESSVSALRAGAWDYLPKPFSAMHFEILMGRAAQAVLAARSERSAAPEGAGLATLGEDVALYGESRALLQVIELASKVAKTDASVFITGESGTGKELIAQFIHLNSRRSDRALVPVNCAAIPDSLLESEMFGHVEGAFTGAVREKEGLLEVANGSTLFLDELTELPLPTQAKLLRVLQDGVVRRVGSTKTDAVVNVRFIAATNGDPVAAVAAGELRRDLYYRLRVVPIHIPALRERKEDIPVLSRRFLAEFWHRHREPGTPLPTLTDSAMQTLRAAPWPGNVRELRNVIEHLVVLATPGSQLTPQDIEFIDEEATSHAGGRLYGTSTLGLEYHVAREEVLARFEVDYVTQVVQSADGNISDAARLAGVDRTTLYRLMEKHGLGRKDLTQSGSAAD